MSVARANRIAAITAGITLALAIGFLRLRGLPILIGAGAVYLGTLAALWPGREQSKRRNVVLPKGVRKQDFQRVDKALRDSVELLRGHGSLRSSHEPTLFQEAADLIQRIRDHLHGNPTHLRVIERFSRHALAHLLRMVTDYADLKRRSLPEHHSRLAVILEMMEAILPALRRIDRACIENDLAELEVSVEVMAEQVGRSRF